MSSPISFWQTDYLNYINLQPSSVRGVNNLATARQKRYLYTMVNSVYKFKLPTQSMGQIEPAENFVRFFIFQLGSIGFLYTKKWGWILLPYGYEKLSFYFQPNRLIFTHPFFDQDKTGIVGVNAGIIKCMDDYFGLDDIVTEYASRLANLDKGADINLMNANVALTYPASNKKQADAIKIAYSDATAGKPFIPVNEELMKEKSIMPLIPGVKNNFVLRDLLIARRMIVNEFLTIIGIPNTTTEKMAQMNVDEINANNVETKTIVTEIYRNLKEGFDMFRDLSGLDVGVELNFDQKIGGNLYDQPMDVLQI